MSKIPGGQLGYLDLIFEFLSFFYPEPYIPKVDHLALTP